MNSYIGDLPPKSSKGKHRNGVFWINQIVVGYVDTFGLIAVSVAHAISHFSIDAYFLFTV
jgi:hypothetical protein